MKLEDFKSGNYKQQFKYKSFIPNSINHEWIWNNNDINILLEQANTKIAELNSLSNFVPDVNLFISMYTNKEAIFSTRIEGTRTEMDELLNDNYLNNKKNYYNDIDDNDINGNNINGYNISDNNINSDINLNINNTEKNKNIINNKNIDTKNSKNANANKNISESRNDKKEVQNYIEAMNYAIKRLQELPISNRLLKETHKILMQGVRGERKYPGEFRKTQNWIGGSNLTDAFFIPPHQDDLPNLMDDLEQFIHNEEIKVPHLIKIALIHYQFETIHPFCDGNGRLGRLLTTLYLINFKVLNKPILYLSYFFEKNKPTYYDYLTNVRKNNDIIRWVLFFLNGVIETSENAKETMMKILKINEEVKEIINKNIKKNKKNINAVIEYLFKKPIVNIEELRNYAKINVNNNIKGDISDSIRINTNSDIETNTSSANINTDDINVNTNNVVKANTDNNIKINKNMSEKTVYNIINKLEELGIVSEITGKQRDKVYSFKKYLDVFKK